MIMLHNVKLVRGTKLLLSSACASFYDKQKIGLVGKNGSGKTSLFLLLQGLLQPDAGDISFAKKLRIVTIEQEIPQSEQSAVEYIIDSDSELRKYQRELILAEKNHDGIKLAAIYDNLHRIDGFTAEARAAKILNGLGFSPQEMATAVNNLSGGWRMRLNIARALFNPSDILLLDEPTNHLDLDAVIWLGTWLQHYPGLLMLISHDRDFLDEITDTIAHIENKQLKIYSGNYSSFEKQRIATLAVQHQQYEKQQKQIEHIESFIKRFKAKASKARQAQSRIKALAKMQEIMPAHIDSPFSFEFAQPDSLANPLLSIQKTSFGYTEELVLKNVDFQLVTQDRVALLGRNGAGKSTLIKLLANELKPNSGNITRNKKLQIGYFAQHTVDRLNENASPLATLQKLAENKPLSELRKFLGGFDFRDDMALMPIQNLSGGEKARLALALIVWQRPNVLLLDEPTNHLDLDMRQALILALQSYEGAVVLVSHDRFLLKQVIDEYWLITDKQLKQFEGGLSLYQDHLLKPSDSKKAVQKKHTPNKANIQKQIAILEKNINKLQRQIASLDSTIVELSADPVSNMAELQKKSTQRTALIKQCEEYEHKWLQLSDTEQID